MKIGKNIYDVGCEMANCKSIAKYRLIFDGELAHDLHICSECLTRMHNELVNFFKNNGQKKIYNITN
ncbi:MAG: hypothetical protein FWG51_03635 [Firmicutes bacterium]|nr:hypothetical protein [Bacillota bacterium]